MLIGDSDEDKRLGRGKAQRSKQRRSKAKAREVKAEYSIQKTGGRIGESIRRQKVYPPGAGKTPRSGRRAGNVRNQACLSSSLSLISFQEGVIFIR